MFPDHDGGESDLEQDVRERNTGAWDYAPPGGRANTSGLEDRVAERNTGAWDYAPPGGRANTSGLEDRVAERNTGAFDARPPAGGMGGDPATDRMDADMGFDLQGDFEDSIFGTLAGAGDDDDQVVSDETREAAANIRSGAARVAGAARKTRVGKAIGKRADRIRAAVPSPGSDNGDPQQTTLDEISRDDGGDGP